MTIEEKVAQLGSVWAFEIVGRRDARCRTRRRRSSAAGSGRSRGSPERPTSPCPEVAAVANEIQRLPRRGNPTRDPGDHPRGVAPRAPRPATRPCFQQSIGAAAAWDADPRRGDGDHDPAPDAHDRRTPCPGAGARHDPGSALGPDRGDLRRGPVSRGRARVAPTSAALQGPTCADGVLATGKHMVGHGMAEGGLNQAPVHVGPRELRDEQLFPFEAAVREAGLASMMPAYCDVDGVPCHASHELLTADPPRRMGLRRDRRLGLRRDPDAVDPAPADRRSGGRRGAAALRAGVDAELPSTVVYGEPLLAAMRRRSGRRGAARLHGRAGPADEVPARACSSARIVEPPVAGRARGARRGRAHGSRASSPQRSLVLVENDGVLPARPGRSGSVAVIGPIADSARELLGDYAHLLHIETLQEMRGREQRLRVPPDRRDRPGRRARRAPDDPGRDHARRLPGARRAARPRDRDQRGLRRGASPRPSSWRGRSESRSSSSASGPA